ncbi:MULTISPECIES: hypothetical protein [Bacillus cereus group]|uniref:Uncharacterized protein n=2 Tax=Bacillus cereus group TaxID=86661 RepID=A0A9X7AZE0_BACTU|nr:MULTISPECIES: hypothetical protein [Bacillus cereus group]MCQ6289226.1 hypothetical protein [Bacillus cereus]MCQ6307420.1 hypothetical protein [Bacillus cereus]MCQ6318738.1 hypothetical protein [Bacillus cereus]MCQ6331559.1 hypothetical protein [Bacillus cereus]MCQ6343251.1 hypothetical protein [Bacillus cereus]
MKKEPIYLSLPPRSKVIVTFYSDKGLSYRALRNMTELHQQQYISCYPNYHKYEINIKSSSGTHKIYTIHANEAKG